MIGGNSWCILRTAPARTLPLAKSLSEAGFEVWTPIVKVKRRTRRGSKSGVEQDVPMMPTFVFAKADHLRDLLRVLALPLNPHPAFSMFRYLDRYPLVRDGEIAALRDAEARAALSFKKSKPNPFAPDAKVRVPEGSFAGMSGVVQEVEGKFAIVAFGGQMRVKIGAWLLVSDELRGASVAVSGTAV